MPTHLRVQVACMLAAALLEMHVIKYVGTPNRRLWSEKQFLIACCSTSMTSQESFLLDNLTADISLRQDFSVTTKAIVGSTCSLD
jgi:hypothetical protein